MGAPPPYPPKVRRSMENPIQINVDHTLCGIHGGLVALTALGRAIEPRSVLINEAEQGAVSVRTNLIRDSINVDKKVVVSNSTSSPVAALLAPIVAESISAIDAAAPDLGWNGVVIGVGLIPRVLAQVSQLAGARSLTTIQEVGQDTGRLSPKGPGKTIFFVHGQDNETINQLLALVPAASTVVLMNSDKSESTRVNFYANLHRKNVDLMSVKNFSPRHARRADSLTQVRMHWEDIELPVIPADKCEEKAKDLAAGGVDGVVLKWE